MGPRSFRWTTLAEYWDRQGIQVDVITAIKPGLATEETINNVQIYRVGGTFVDNLRSKLNKSDPYVNQNHQQQASAQNHSRSKLLSILKMMAARSASVLHHGIWKNIWWPDMTCLWYFAIIRQAKQLIAQHQYDAIITSSPSFTAHVAGYRLKKKNPQIAWLVDIGDPFCFVEDDFPNNRLLYGRWNYAFERKVFRMANSVSVTTSATADKYAELFPESADKITVIPPLGGNSLPESPNADPIFESSDKTRLVFAGSLYKHIRRPDFLLNLFAALLETSLKNNIELHFFGNTENCEESFEPYQHLLGNQIWTHGLVSRDIAIQAMRESDILVNISNNSRYQLPSKVVEYTGLGKPILNIAQIADDSSTAFFAEYPAALCLLNTTDIPSSDQISSVQNFIENPPPELDGKTLQTWIAKFDIPTISAAYEALLTGGK